VKRKSKRLVMVKMVKSEDYGGRWPERVKGVHIQYNNVVQISVG
jgi:hypothetical protein